VVQQLANLGTIGMLAKQSVNLERITGLCRLRRQVGHPMPRVNHMVHA
jgi:hypothetical protein